MLNFFKRLLVMPLGLVIFLAVVLIWAVTYPFTGNELHIRYTRD